MPTDYIWRENEYGWFCDFLCERMSGPPESQYWMECIEVRDSIAWKYRRLLPPPSEQPPLDPDAEAKLQALLAEIDRLFPS